MNTKIHFYIRTDRPAKDGSVQIYLMLTINRKQRLKISTGKYIPLKKEYQKLSKEKIQTLLQQHKENLYYWDTQKERATKGARNSEKINQYLDNEKTRANQILLKYELLNKPISIQLFKNAYLVYILTNINQGFFSSHYEVLYVGRGHLSTRLKKRIGSYTHFYYRVANNEYTRFRVECEEFHRYGKGNKLHNQIHSMLFISSSKIHFESKSQLS